MALRIVNYGEPVLRREGKRITRFDQTLDELSREMKETLRFSDHGIGLAAQQVGVARQVCLIDLRGVDSDFEYILDETNPPLDLIMPLVLVNPKVRPRGEGGEETAEEGCLSIPGIRAPVSRPPAVTVRFQDIRGGHHLLQCGGLFARCLLHEVDHLNGVLFIDRLAKRDLNALSGRLKKLRQATRDYLRAHPEGNPGAPVPD